MSNVYVYSSVVNNGPGPVSPWSLYIGILWHNSAVPWKQLNLFNKCLLLMTFETNNYSIRNDKNTICTALVKRTCRKVIWFYVTYEWESCVFVPRCRFSVAKFPTVYLKTRWFRCLRSAVRFMICDLWWTQRRDSIRLSALSCLRQRKEPRLPWSRSVISPQTN